MSGAIISGTKKRGEYMWFFFIAVAVVIIVIIYKAMNSDSASISVVDSVPNLKGARIFRAVGDSFIAINKNGYIGIKTLMSEKLLVFHVRDLIDLDARKNSKNSGGLFSDFFRVEPLEKINSLSIVFTINNFDNPLIELKFMDVECTMDSMIFKSAFKTMEEVWTLIELLQKNLLQDN